MVNTYSRRPSHWWRLWPSQVLPECRSLAFEGRAQTFQFPPALAAPGRPRWWPWWSACWHLGRSPGYDWCPRSRYQLEERGENRILKNWKDQGVHLLAFICVTFSRDGLSLARTDSNRAAFGQIRSRPPHFDLHVSVALIHVIVHLSKIKHWRWETKRVRLPLALVNAFLLSALCFFLSLLPGSYLPPRWLLTLAVLSTYACTCGNLTPVRRHPRCHTSHL